MDSTHLFKTARTTDATQLYYPSPPGLDTSILSQSPKNFYGSRIVSVPVMEQSVLQFQPAQQRVVPQPKPVVRPMSASGPVYEQVYVYCPVCRRQFSNSEVDFHAQLHTAIPSYNFFIENTGRTVQAGSTAAPVVGQSLDKTKVTMDASQISATTAVSNGVQYPMIEPLEFWTNELKDSAKNDVFIYRDNKNYDAVDRSLFEIAKSKPLPTYIDSEAQTYRKPPLQYESNQTNLYNCLDNAVNAKNGPKFSFADLTKNNKIITPKRQLDDWEIMQKNISETYVPTTRAVTKV